MAVGSEKLLAQMRRRLTMQNLGIVALIFMILTAITYSYVDYSLYRTKQERIEAVSEAMTQPDWAPRKRLTTSQRPSLGYLHIAPNGTLLRAASNLPFEMEEWRDFAKRAVGEHGHITYGGTDIYYAWSQSPYGLRVIAFETDTMEKAILDNIFWTFIIAVLCSLGAFYLMSRYLAEKAVRPIETAWAQQKAFIADASHELRTPLTVIRTNLDVVMCSPEETVEEQKEWLDNIREETDEMKELVESLFFLAQADAHQQRLECDPFDCRDMIASAVRAYTPMAEEKGITLTADLGEENIIYGDDGKLRRVLRVLVENAIRHTDAGGTISVKLTDDGKTSCLTVTDTGEGIAPDALGHLFERFYQADSSRRKGGAGLGLAIAKWIVEAHGGTISAASILGQGATFTVRLPKTGMSKGGTNV
ncbi:MAG: HAMP domain-containing histidine kinase [Selenomonadales bacterium]|nr:HAMP domain-containing histidine kinase [Selenomonadales bacterium]